MRQHAQSTTFGLFVDASLFRLIDWFHINLLFSSKAVYGIFLLSFPLGPTAVLPYIQSEDLGLLPEGGPGSRSLVRPGGGCQGDQARGGAGLDGGDSDGVPENHQCVLR